MKRPAGADAVADDSSSSTSKRPRTHVQGGDDDDVNEEIVSGDLAALLEYSNRLPWIAVSPANVMFPTEHQYVDKAAAAPAGVFSATSLSSSSHVAAGAANHSKLHVLQESCGSSVSGADSSVMAGIDVGTATFDLQWLEFEKLWAEGSGECGFDGACGARGGENKEDHQSKVDLDLEWDDETLARFFGEDLKN